MNSLEKYYSAKLKSIGAQGSTFNKIKIGLLWYFS